MSGYINAFDIYDHNLRGRDNAPEVAAGREPPSLEKNLFMASSKGQLGRVSAILRSSDNIDLFAKVNGLTSLHSAAKKGFTDVCKALLSYPKESADVSRLVLTRTEVEAKTALMLAAFHGQLETVRVLVSSANAHFPLTDIVGAVDEKGNTCIHYAAWGGHIECVQYFGDFLGAQALDVQNDEGLTPLQLATAGDFHSIVAYITQKTQDCAMLSGDGSSLSNSSGEVSSSGMTALHRAASHGAYDTANYILQRSEMSVNQQANNGNTALHYAAQHGHKAIVQLLIQQPAVDISVANEYGLSPFHYACLGGYDEIVSLLLPILNAEQATKVNAQGESALHLAAAAGEHKVCQLLLNDSRILFDVFASDKSGASPIDKAVESGHKGLANKLVMFSCVTNKAKELELCLQGVHRL